MEFSRIPKLRDVENELSRRDLLRFAVTMMPELEITPFHRRFYSVLDRFVRRKLQRLIISVPPQHGKSLGASRIMPAYMLGLDPSLKICIGSYSMALARKFNTGVRRMMVEARYKEIFPGVQLSDTVCNAQEFEIAATEGGLRAAGRGSALTGNRVDIMILDDLYKNAMEANSPLIRENAWDWYTSVVKTRLHNDSSELIVFTRWHEDDLIGQLEKSGLIIEVTAEHQLDEIPAGHWAKINFEAVKESLPTPLDPREHGEALWPQRHSRETLEERRKLDPAVFEAMYQGHPGVSEGVLYGDFSIYNALPGSVLRFGNYTDTADTGSDNLCSVCYAVGSDGLCYVTDLVYTAEPMEITEEAVAMMLTRGNVSCAYIESNNGGRGFARNVGRAADGVVIESFYQSRNKEARIVTAAAEVVKRIVMPADWRIRWPKFYADVTSYRRRFRGNRHHDAADVLTGIIEKEFWEKEAVPKSKKAKVKKMLFKIK